MNLSVFHSNLSTVFSSVAPNNITSTSINVASDTEEAIATTTTNLRTRTTQETTTVLTRTTFITAAATLKTTNFVGHPFQNDNHWIRAGDRTPSEDNLETENEMGLLWLPYVIFTVVLLGLIAMSFVRFHCQRGDQYRRRRSELEDKEPTGNGQSMLAASYQPNGGSAAVPDKPVRCGDVPEHMVLFLQFTETETPSGTGSGSQDDWTETKRLCATQRVFGGFKAQSKVPSVDTALGGGVSGDGGGGGKQQRVTCHRRPLTFTFNINGSMVDIRCSDEERTKTFHLSTGAGKAIGGQGIGKQTAPALEMVDPSGDGFCLSAAVGDEEDGRRYSGNKLEEPRAATTTTTTTTLSSSSRRSSSNKVQGCVRGIGGTGGGAGGGEAKGGGRGLGYGTGGAVNSQQHKVLMYSTSTTETCDLRQNSSSADEALFLLHPGRS